MRRLNIAVVALMGCGCGPKVWNEPPIEDLSCSDSRRSSEGCGFAATPVLHIMTGIGELAGTSRTAWEPDGIFVVNPGPGEARVQPVTTRNDGEEYALSEVLTLSPGQRRVIRVPTLVERVGTALEVDNVVRISSDAPIAASIYAPYRSFLGNDSGLLLPESAWGRHYVIPAYTPHSPQFQGLGEPTFFEVVALAGGTTVRWLAQFASTAADGPVAEVEQGAWSPEIGLDEHQSLRVAGAPWTSDRRHDVSGCVVEASGPIWVMSGSRCSAVPARDDAVSGCDPLLESLVPIELWGSTYAVAHPPLRTNEEHYYRIYAGDGGVEIETTPSVLPGSTHTFASRGDFVEVSVPHGMSFVVTASGPVLTVGYLKTRDNGEQVGDPAMYQLVSEEQWLRRYVVATGVEWQMHLIHLVRRAGGTGSVLLDGVTVDGWEAFDDFEVAVVEVTEGTHDLESDAPFTATQFGWTNDVHDACLPYASQGTCQTSYAHPAGMATNVLNDL